MVVVWGYITPLHSTPQHHTTSHNATQDIKKPIAFNSDRFLSCDELLGVVLCGAVE